MELPQKNLESFKQSERVSLRRRLSNIRLVSASGRGSFGISAAATSAEETDLEWSRESWLRRLEGFSQLELGFDSQDKILWFYITPSGQPYITLEIAREIRTAFQLIRELFQEQSEQAEAPIRYWVSSSKIPGIFNLGGDLRYFAKLIRQRDRERLLEYATACVDIVYLNAVSLELPVITIALVCGDALGGGVEAAISSNVVIAERSAKFGLPEIMFNLFPGMGAYSLIARRIGAAQAERMILSGHIYSAEELYNLGLVDVLVEDGMGDEAVYEYVEQHGRRHAAHSAVYDVRRRVKPLSYEEMLDVARLWVDTALKLEESDLRRMERLAAAQDRRVELLNKGA